MRVAIPVGLTIDLVDGWLDVSDDLPAGSPFTLARSDGVGAFQFSSGLYRSGLIPGATTQDLHRMLDEFCASRGLGVPTDVREALKAVAIVAGTTVSDGFARLWFMSDGRSFALASYSAESAFAAELEECEEMIRSVTFIPQTAQPGAPDQRP